MTRPPTPPTRAAAPGAAERRRTTASPDITGICPYLLAASGRWRSARPSREHRCTAIATPLPIGADKQLELCLADRHVTCPRFVAARTQSDEAAVGKAHGIWAYGATVPVLLEGPGLRFVIPRTVHGRPVGQVLLGLLMVLAFVAVVLARGAAPA